MISKPSLLSVIFVIMSFGVYGMEAAESRKAITEKFLSSKNVPINFNLPLIEDERTAKLRKAQEAATRIVVLYHLAAIGYGIEKEKVAATLIEAGVGDRLTPYEREFLNSDNPTNQQLANATWRVEAVWALLWSIGKIDTLEFPTNTCNMEQLHAILPAPKNTKRFIETAQLRNIESILNETDMIYRIHWAIRDAQLNRRSIPANLHLGVVVERHYALNWLTWYAEEWDDISTDT